MWPDKEKPKTSIKFNVKNIIKIIYSGFNKCFVLSCVIEMLFSLSSIWITISLITEKKEEKRMNQINNSYNASEAHLAYINHLRTSFLLITRKPNETSKVGPRKERENPPPLHSALVSLWISQLPSLAKTSLQVSIILFMEKYLQHTVFDIFGWNSLFCLPAHLGTKNRIFSNNKIQPTLLCNLYPSAALCKLCRRENYESPYNRDTFKNPCIFSNWSIPNYRCFHLG